MRRDELSALAAAFIVLLLLLGGAAAVIFFKKKDENAPKAPLPQVVYPHIFKRGLLYEVSDGGKSILKIARSIVSGSLKISGCKHV